MTPNPTVKPMEALETLDRAVAQLKSEIDSFYLCTINGDTRSMIKAAQPVVDAYAALVENYADLSVQQEAAGIVSGEDADAILREMRDGTPDTPKRVETVQRADAVYASQQEAGEASKVIWVVEVYDDEDKTWDAIDFRHAKENADDEAVEIMDRGEPDDEIRARVIAYGPIHAQQIVSPPLVQENVK